MMTPTHPEKNPKNAKAEYMTVLAFAWSVLLT